jgi:hypothetical protein
VVRQYAIGKGHSVSVLWRGGEVDTIFGFEKEAEVRVVGEGDRQRTRGTGGKVIQTRDAGNSMGKNTWWETDC